jgi:group I intron endonuclease
MPIVRAIQKYGRENFEIKVLARCASIEEMNHREEYYIKIFNTLSPNGYNLDSGGKNRRTHQSTKDKLSKIHKGRPGKAPSQETRDKIAKANFGKKCSKKTRNKMSESRSGSNNPNFGGKSVTEKQRQALREYSTGRPSPRRKKVLCVTTGTVYPFLMEAAKVLGINFQAIARVCSGERPHTHGLIFKYI